uniref:Reverse transcriptase domain-containing protein n=1 Tax=Tanacetum cinerariifolium TaxID=118510 RepID=A0A6L2N314_TANCI|nr:hypothetical protein [Tanacetum cinerariifolium]
MKSIQTFLKKFNRISFIEIPKVLSRAWEKFFEIQHAQPEDINELLHKLLEDLQIISEELAEYINSSSWNHPAFYDDDDDDYSIQYNEYIENSSNAIAPVLPTKEPEYSLTDFDLDEAIHLVENLLYDNLSPQPPKELNAKIADTIVEFLSPTPIPIEDSDSQMEEIDLFLDTDGLMPPGIKNDDYDSERDIHFLKEFLSNDTPLLPKNESSNFDHHDDPSFSRPPPEPPDVEVFFEPDTDVEVFFEPDTGVLTAKVVEDISEHHMPNLLPTQPTICPNIDPLL